MPLSASIRLSWLCGTGFRSVSRRASATIPRAWNASSHEVAAMRLVVSSLSASRAASNPASPSSSIASAFLRRSPGDRGRSIASAIGRGSAGPLFTTRSRTGRRLAPAAGVALGTHHRVAHAGDPTVAAPQALHLGDVRRGHGFSARPAILRGLPHGISSLTTTATTRETLMAIPTSNTAVPPAPWPCKIVIPAPACPLRKAINMTTRFGLDTVNFFISIPEVRRYGVGKKEEDPHRVRAVAELVLDPLGAALVETCRVPEQSGGLTHGKTGRGRSRGLDVHLHTDPDRSVAGREDRQVDLVRPDVSELVIHRGNTRVLNPSREGPSVRVRPGPSRTARVELRVVELPRGLGGYRRRQRRRVSAETVSVRRRHARAGGGRTDRRHGHDVRSQRRVSATTTASRRRQDYLTGGDSPPDRPEQDRDRHEDQRQRRHSSPPGLSRHAPGHAADDDKPFGRGRGLRSRPRI